MVFLALRKVGSILYASAALQCKRHAIYKLLNDTGHESSCCRDFDDSVGVSAHRQKERDEEGVRTDRAVCDDVEITKPFYIATRLSPRLDVVRL